MNKKALFNFLRVTISIGLIAFLFWLMRGSIGDVTQAMRTANKWTLLLSFLVVVIGMFLLSVRLRSLMKAQHLPVSLKDAIYLTFIGQFFSNFLPTSSGGDIVKAFYAARKTGKKVHSIAAIIFDRLLGTFTLILMVLITSLIVKRTFLSSSITTFLFIALALSLVLFLIIFNKGVAKKIPFLGFFARLFNAEGKTKDLYEIINNYKKHPVLLMRAILISILLQSLMFCAVYLVIRSLGYHVSLKLVFLWMPIISTAAMAPSINGLGVREGAFVLFFQSAMGKQGAFALSILWFGINFCISLIGGVFYLFTRQHKEHQAAT